VGFLWYYYWLQCSPNHWTSTKGNRSAKTGQRLANNINLKLWTEKAFGSFRGYHRFSTTLLNSAKPHSSPSFSQLKAQNCGALLHICCWLTDLTRKFSLGTSNLWYFAWQSSQMGEPHSIRRGTLRSFLGRGRPSPQGCLQAILVLSWVAHWW